MKMYRFVIILLIACIALAGGCAAGAQPEIPEVPAHELSASEAAFIARLNEAGLNWTISDRQRIVDPYYQAIERNRLYFIVSPSELVFGMINIRTGAGHHWGEKFISMSFGTNRMPIEGEFARLHEEGLLAEDEWALFWAFAGEVLGEEEYVASIAARATEHFADFPFNTFTGDCEDISTITGEFEDISTITWEDREGDVDCWIEFLWAPYLERYAWITIELTVGMDDFIREHIHELGIR